MISDQENPDNAFERIALLNKLGRPVNILDSTQTVIKHSKTNLGKVIVKYQLMKRIPMIMNL